jgi:hypothetical protein
METEYKFDGIFTVIITEFTLKVTKFTLYHRTDLFQIKMIITERVEENIESQTFPLMSSKKGVFLSSTHFAAYK